MSNPEQTMRKLIVLWGLLTVLCCPAFAETSLPERERLEVGNALSWQAVIPASANSPGRFGAHYKTRVVIFNPTSRDYSIVARLYGANGLISREDIAINSGQYIVWDRFSTTPEEARSG